MYVMFTEALGNQARRCYDLCCGKWSIQPAYISHLTIIQGKHTFHKDERREFHREGLLHARGTRGWCRVFLV